MAQLIIEMIQDEARVLFISLRVLHAVISNTMALQLSLANMPHATCKLSFYSLKLQLKKKSLTHLKCTNLTFHLAK